MGILIEDGKGTGRTAAVTPDNQLQVHAISLSIEHDINHSHGESYNMVYETTPAGADDCFLYLKNLHDLDLVIEGIWIHDTASEYVDVKLLDIGVPASGSDVTPANLNAGSSKSALGTFQQGTDITGLTGGVTNHRIWHLGSAGITNYNFDQDIIVPKNGVFTLYAGTGTTLISGLIVFNYHDSVE